MPGLVHDIGKIVEVLFLKKEFAQINATVKAQNILIKQAEEDLLGYTHSDVGKLLGEQWDLSPNHVDAIAHLNDLVVSERFSLETSIVHLGDILCRSLDIGSGGDRKMPLLHEKAMTTMGLTINDIESILENLEFEYFDIRSFAMTA